MLIRLTTDGRWSPWSSDPSRSIRKGHSGARRFICARPFRPTDRPTDSRSLGQPSTDLESRDQFSPNVIGRRKKAILHVCQRRPRPPSHSWINFPAKQFVTRRRRRRRRGLSIIPQHLCFPSLWAAAAAAQFVTPFHFLSQLFNRWNISKHLSYLGQNKSQALADSSQMVVS